MKAALVFMGLNESVAASIALVGHAIATYPWTLLPLPFIMPVVFRERSATLALIAKPNTPTAKHE